jgi:hypothetical protein
MGRQGGGEDSCPVAGGGVEMWLLAENGADISLVAGGGAQKASGRRQRSHMEAG